MATLLEYVGNVHIFLGPYRGNPVALYLKRNGDRCIISPKVYPWNDVIGTGETPNKAAADFEEKWKAKGLAPEMYTGPTWEGGIKPERPKPAPPPKPAQSAPGSQPAPGAAAPAAQSAGTPPPRSEGSPGPAAPQGTPDRAPSPAPPSPPSGSNQRGAAPSPPSSDRTREEPSADPPPSSPGSTRDNNQPCR